ncbi:Nramp family divalent metal transporter [Maribellus maritimus]|uniref:Nramp family divalent metal transporter n=1 Tax=Maribellus maritimus TaxID=2870838 RepID=UPI001EEA455D|nr:Nramp family divalent metal transporter [Maribellus maritimus]MCG6186734.1 Nramp family divalent metal transporter [Maribellus maritimus]
MSKNIFKKIIVGLAAVGPGLFLIGYNIGTGSVTTMSKSGAEYGMSLFWALVLSCVFTFILMVAYGKVTLVTGKTALFNIKSEFKYGWLLALYILIALIIGELLALIGVMGIVAELLQEGIRILTDGKTVNTLWIILIIVPVLYLLLWFGRYKQFEKVLTVFVILMGVSFIVVFFMLKPDYSTILQGMIPSIPDKPGALGLVAAMAGTTCSAAVFIVRSTVVAEKGWTIKNLKNEKRDAFVSAAMMLFLSGIIMAVSAGTLHIMGLKLDNTVDMIHLFQPLGGKWAALILIFGITGAGLSTVFPIVLIAPWLVSDYMGKPRDVHSPLFRWLMFLGIIFAFGSVFLKHRPPALMIFSQAFQACILPAVAIPIFVLMNRKKIMNTYIAGWKMNLGVIAVILFSFLTTYYAIVELF